MKLTKQGVRDLDGLPGKSRGRRLPAPPKNQERASFCKHRNRYEVGDGRFEKCEDCGGYVEVVWYG